MGCFGKKEKGELEDSQKWAYVTLSDFKASGALAYFSYAWLWFLALIAIAVYGADTFTAINLLVYDKWGSQIQPAIPLKYSKWIFAGCIFFSWALAAFEFLRAIRVMRRGSVAESYMDPLALNLQSMRGQGWKRFLVFAELTKSKKGMDYIALFVYFSFQSALRVLVAEAPRQVINAITLYSVMKADLIPNTTTDRSSIEQFFVNIELLAESNREQVVILFSMLFTLIIWLISALSLLASVILYVTFLWHYIPQQDGRLSIYCKRKIDRRLSKIVGAKVKQAMEDQEKEREREEARAAKKHNGNLPGRPQPPRQPTLPNIASTTPRVNDDKLPDFKLSRQGSEATLPAYSSQPPSIRTGPSVRHANATLPRQPTLPDMGAQDGRPGMPSRSGTQASNTSYSSNAPLLGNATGMGYVEDHDGYPAQPRPVLDRQASSSYGQRPVPGTRPGPGRQLSTNSNGSRPLLDRQASAAAQSGQLLDRQMSASPYAMVPDRQMSASPYAARPFPGRQMTASPYNQMQAPERQMAASPYAPDYAPERQMTASPYGQMPALDRQVSASPYGGRPVPDRQMSASTNTARPPIMRTLTPLTEVSSRVPSTAGALTDSIYSQDQYRSSPAPMEPPQRQANYTPVYGSYPDPVPRQTTYTPVYGSVADHNIPKSTSPTSDNSQTQAAPQNFARPFSPPTQAAPARALTDRYNPTPAASGQAYEMTARPPTAPPALATAAPSSGAPGYVAFNPTYSSIPARGQPGLVKRNLTNPANAHANLNTTRGPEPAVPQRSFTAPPEGGAYEDLIDDYHRDGSGQPQAHAPPVARNATAGPGGYAHTYAQGW